MNLICIYVYFEAYIDHDLQLKIQRMIVKFYIENKSKDLLFGYDSLFDYNVKNSIIVYVKNKHEILCFVK